MREERVYRSWFFTLNRSIIEHSSYANTLTTSACFGFIKLAEQFVKKPTQFGRHDTLI
jgi:hypothetical protein